MTIEEVRDGIIFQARINGKKGAYNLFCEEQEKAFKYIISQINSESKCIPLDTDINFENLAVKTATMAFASKTIAEKTVGLEKKYIGGFKNE